MARLRTDTPNPVAILSDQEWLTVEALCQGDPIPEDRLARRLRKAGIIDDVGLTQAAAPAFQGRATASRYLEVVRLGPREGVRQVLAWIGPSRTTMMKSLTDGLHVYGLDACEVPSAFAEFLDFHPRPLVEAEPVVVPAPEATGLLSEGGDLSPLASIFTRVGKRLRSGSHPGAAGDTTPLIEGLVNQTWSISIITASVRVPSVLDWQVDSSLHTFSVPECLYEFYPRSLAQAAGRSPGSGGDPDDLIMDPTTAMIAWLRAVPWFFA
ncbi:hypothetical protein [Actinomyces wuliandei]|uniref:hypothetical protein n=1 Tax=Actinomyces wuliandei TaxID=2057743 RepID=UPI00111AF08B|nr:hypothetical protein [Actinomyces wuliandei]